MACLRGRGRRFRSSRDGRREPTDVAILDLQMPRLNGIDAGRQITALLPGIPVLIISAHDSDFGYLRDQIDANSRLCFKGYSPFRSCSWQSIRSWRGALTFQAWSSGMAEGM